MRRMRAAFSPAACRRQQVLLRARALLLVARPCASASGQLPPHCALRRPRQPFRRPRDSRLHCEAALAYLPHSPPAVSAPRPKHAFWPSGLSAFALDELVHLSPRPPLLLLSPICPLPLNLAAPAAALRACVRPATNGHSPSLLHVYSQLIRATRGTPSPLFGAYAPALLTPW